MLPGNTTRPTSKLPEEFMGKEIKLSKVVLDALEEVIDIVEGLGIEYAVMGGIALQAWGRERVTRDIDLIIYLGKIGPTKFLRALVGAGFKISRKSIPQKKESLLPIACYYEEKTYGLPLEIDFFIAETDYQKKALERSLGIEVLGKKVKIIQPEDLILHKLLANRPIDRADVETVILEQKDSLDKEYLFYWSKQLGVDRRLNLLLKRDARFS